MVLYVDGGCSGNGQRDIAVRTMVAVVTDDSGTVLSESEADGGSNNIAELMAVYDALTWAATNGLASVTIRTDSRNNFAWVLGRKLGKRLNDRERVMRLKEQIAIRMLQVRLSLVWVPRDQNLAGHYIERKWRL